VQLERFLADTIIPTSYSDAADWRIKFISARKLLLAGSFLLHMNERDLRVLLQIISHRYVPAAADYIILLFFPILSPIFKQETHVTKQPMRQCRSYRLIGVSPIRR